MAKTALDLMVLPNGRTRAVFANAAIFTGEDPYRFTLGSILINGTRIEAVEFGEAGPLTEVADAEIIDCRGLYAMPGLVNMHSHLTFMYLTGPTRRQFERSQNEQFLHAVQIAAVLLSQGVTTTREMGGRYGIPFAIRDAVNAGELAGPRIVACGEPIAATGGHAWHICVEATGPDAFAKAAREQMKAGADFVKVMASHDPWRPVHGTQYTRPELSFDEAEAAFAAAASWGYPTACHVMGSVAIERVITAGVEIIDHGQYLTAEQARTLVDRGIYLVPTLSSYDFQTFSDRFHRGEEWCAEHRLLLDGHRSAIEAAVGAGVKMLVGTDSVGAYSQEVALLREAGVSGHDSLLACTRWAAEALGLQSEIGTITARKCADIAFFARDPLGDPYALDEPRLVVKGGVGIFPEQLLQPESMTRCMTLRALASPAGETYGGSTATETDRAPAGLDPTTAAGN